MWLVTFCRKSSVNRLISEHFLGCLSLFLEEVEEVCPARDLLLTPPLGNFLRKVFSNKSNIFLIVFEHRETSRYFDFCRNYLNCMVELDKLGRVSCGLELDRPNLILQFGSDFLEVPILHIEDLPGLLHSGDISDFCFCNHWDGFPECHELKWN